MKNRRAAGWFSWYGVMSFDSDLLQNTSGCSAFLPRKKRGLSLIDNLTCPGSDSASVYQYVKRGTSRLADVRPPVFKFIIFTFVAYQRRNPIFGGRYRYANKSFFTFWVDQVQTFWIC